VNVPLNTEADWKKAVDGELADKTEHLAKLQEQLSKKVATKKVQKYTRELPEIAKNCRKFAAKAKDRQRRFEDEEIGRKRFQREYQVGAWSLCRWLEDASNK